MDVIAKSTNSYLLPFIVIAITTGASKTEILNLTWANVDLESGLVELKETKNGTSRTVYLVGPAPDLMNELYEKSELYNFHVFQSKKRFGTLSMRKACKKALADAGIQDLHVHDLRNQFCTTAA